MTFLHVYLLAGLLLTGVPILIHLVTRQKPRRLPFPAFRFLRQRQLINRRKLRLRHLLLLALRMAVIAALCLALARPGERAARVVLLFDTSLSMEYQSGGQTRLDEARRLAGELLAGLPDGSEVAVLDSGDDTGGQWFPTGDLARVPLAGLHTRPANAPLTRQLDTAFRLLQETSGADDPPRFLYLFSDRTRACWDEAEARKLHPPEGVRLVFVDVAAPRPRDLAIEDVRIDPPVVAPGAPLLVRVTLRGTGTGDAHVNELVCRFSDEGDARELRREVRLPASGSEEYVFERRAPVPAPGGPTEFPGQVAVSLKAGDDLLFNNKRYATFIVRAGRKLLTIADDPTDARAWSAALQGVAAERPVEGFQNEVVSPDAAARLTDAAWGTYKAVCLFETAAPPAALWKKLAEYVARGGGLFIVPGGAAAAARIEVFNRAGTAAGLLPASLDHFVKTPPGRPARWAEAFSPRHPVTAFFYNSLRTGSPDYGTPAAWPLAHAYWAVRPVPGEGRTLAAFAGGAAALLERTQGRGKILLLTTPLDVRRIDRNRYAHNYWSDSSFGIVLVDQVCRYLAGDATLPDLNGTCGQVVALRLPSPPLTFHGQGVAASESTLTADDRGEVSLPPVMGPGNFTVRDSQDRAVAGFSLNVRREESVLDPVPAEEIEAVLGKGSLLSAGGGEEAREALRGLKAPPFDWLPVLMIVVLLVLTVESLLANRFYRRAAPAPAEAAASTAEPERMPS